jgi:DNA-binding NarL/FixJ family response regulator
VIRVFVADDHEVVCEGLHAWVDTIEGAAWAGSVHTGDAVLGAVAAGDFDVLVLDLSLPGRSGSELLREVRALRPDLRVVICSM